MKNLKKRLAILLTLIMIVPYIITCLPTATLTSQAGGWTTYSEFGWIYQMTPNSKGTGKLVMQVGQSVKIGGLVNKGDASALNYSGKFYSSNSKVASFDKNGTLTAKKTGSTKITCTYDGQKLKCNVTVLKKGSIKEASSSTVKKFTKDVNALEKLVKKGITAKNCYTVHDKLVSLSDQMDELYSMDIYGGFLSEYSEDTYTYESTNKLVVPAYYTYLDIEEKLNIYLWDTPSSNVTDMGLEFKPKNITVKNAKKSTKITVKLDHKITKKEFLVAWVAANGRYEFNTSTTEKIMENKEVTTMINIRRVTKAGTSGDVYTTAAVTMKIGSNKMVINVDRKLEKGKYQLCNIKNTKKFITDKIIIR